MSKKLSDKAELQKLRTGHKMSKEEVRKKVQKELFVLQDLRYRDFHAKLIPSVDKEKVIGIRTPALRAYAKKFGKKEEAKQFLEILPHQYYEGRM